MTESKPGLNRLSVDIGGTFTDIVIEAGARRFTLKVLTTTRAPEEAVLAGSLELLEAAKLRPGDLDMFVHGTTLATNAIIERKGARTALIATEGFRDILDIADESRYNQFDIFIERLKPLAERHLRFTVPERVDAAGRIVLPLDEAAVRAVARRLRAEKVESVAVALMHSYAQPAHELRIRDILAEEVPELYVSLSCEVSPEIREYERTSTVLANAYVQKLISSYLSRLGEELERRGFRCPLYLMTSGGGLTTLRTAGRFPIRLVESGPAGGAILASHLASENGVAKALSFDMGGTTAKICLIENSTPQTSRSFEVDRRDRFMKGSGFPLRIPVIEMVEIGAGGGSIAHVDAMRRIAVGPESAGAEPGPACYGRGGESPTVTDADVLLGRIDPDGLAGGRIRLDAGKAASAISERIGASFAMTDALAAFGISEIVDENMANAARVHAVERGKAVADYTLIAFGGAAPLHVARLAEKLGIARIIVPPNAGVGSAIGFLRAPIAFEVVRSRYMRLADLDPVIANELIAEMRAEAHEVVAPGAAGAELVEVRHAFMRYVGQGHEIVVPLPAGELSPADGARLRADFEREYTQLFARTIPNAEIEILTWTLSLGTRAVPAPSVPPVIGSRFAEPVSRRKVYDPQTGSDLEVPVYRRSALGQGARLTGPAIIAEDETTTFVTASFDASINAQGCIVLDRKS
ncbi:N-methylhydantoinase A [Rhizobiales bacterium GAS113]|nr:N-methylhydantoinase A [Rhizobiales bacterium GAS113]